MKTEIPDNLRSDLPPNVWGKILGATPVVMTVVATALAGLASSEMTRAQYDRSLAAQLQSKAGDQWGLFQAKRMRGALERGSLDLLSSSFELHPPDVAALAQVLGPSPAKDELQGFLTSNEGQGALESLRNGSLPAAAGVHALGRSIAAATEAVESLAPEAEVSHLLAPIPDADLNSALRSAGAELGTFDRSMQPASRLLSLLGTALAQQGAGADLAVKRDVTAARLRLDAQRYDAEARLNRALANIYELQVRKGNLSAERHHLRSQQFFYGMLGAQMAVIIATFAIAARRRSLLWSLAAAAGAGAVMFAIYVYVSI